MVPISDPLEMTCPKCSCEFAVDAADDSPLQCPQCGFRLDLDPALFEDGLMDAWPDEVEAR